MEVELGLFSRKGKTAGGVVAVCQESGGASVAYLVRGKDGRATLHQSAWLPAETAIELERQLGQFVREHGLQEWPCVAVLPLESYQLIQVEMPELPENERREAVRWQIRELLDFPAEEAVVDLYDVAPFQSEKQPFTFVVAARQALLRQRVELIQSAELSLQAIDIPEFSLRNLTQLFTEDERGLAVLLLQAEGGTLIVARNGILYLTRTLATGMNDLRPYADGNFEALTEQLDGVVLEVQRSFDYCESTFHLPMVSRLLVVQTGQEIPSVISYLDDYLSTTVESFNFSGVLKIPEGTEQLSLNRNLLAVGGALREIT